MIILKEDRSNKYNPVHKKMHELWRSMIGRCCQPKNGSYKNYGARGVKTCEKWKTYDGFLEDVDSIDGYDLDKLLNGELELDKDIKVTGNKIYSLETCTFVSSKVNSGNRRNNVWFIAINYETKDVVCTNNREEFCRNYNLDTSSCWRVLQSSVGNNTRGKQCLQHKKWTLQYLDSFSLAYYKYVLSKKGISFDDNDSILDKLSELGVTK